MKTVELTIPSISCHHCVMTIKREAGRVPGVEFLSGDVGAKTAAFRVVGDAELSELKGVLEEAGYPAIE